MRRPPAAVRRAHAPSKAELARVRLLAVDVDGTLTDGAMYYGPDGEVLKRFHTRDGLGLCALARAGVETALITGEDSPIAAARARKLGISRVHLGVKDKLAVLRSMAGALGLAPGEVAYMGDDLNDLDCLRWAGVAACPADAVAPARNASRFVCRLPGGHGAVREFCDALLAARLVGSRAV